MGRTARTAAFRAAWRPEVEPGCLSGTGARAVTGTARASEAEPL
ncbi:hypothetical protein [Spongiactinospora sp. TRM90649]|nr:hypothetical protein [Spongiactinospora sp. TRM90649]MDF5752229.1 hypothetical protein [Spongiactinospora sp. TRM90649]